MDRETKKAIEKHLECILITSKFKARDCKYLVAHEFYYISRDEFGDEVEDREGAVIEDIGGHFGHIYSETTEDDLWRAKFNIADLLSYLKDNGAEVHYDSWAE